MSSHNRLPPPHPLTDPSIITTAVEQVKSWTSFITPFIDSLVGEEERVEEPHDEEGKEPIKTVCFKANWDENGELKPLIILTYARGFHIYVVHDTGSVEEIVSILDEDVQATEVIDRDGILLAVISMSTIKFFAPKQNEYISESLVFSQTIENVRSSCNYLAVSLATSVHIYAIDTLEKVIEVQSHYESTGVCAIGPHWLAYCGSQDLPRDEGIHSALLSMAPAAPAVEFISGLARDVFGQEEEDQPDLATKGTQGTVVVLDIPSNEVIVHFRAHNSPLSTLEFNGDGTLLATADTEGCEINVYSIGVRGQYSHLYKLIRGFTSATIVDICFSFDSRWLTASSDHGTTHIFPIHPAGGPTSALTHVSSNMSKVTRRMAWQYTQQLCGLSECQSMDSSARIWTNNGVSCVFIAQCETVSKVYIYTVSLNGVLKVYECVCEAVDPAPLLSVSTTPIHYFELGRDANSDQVKFESVSLSGSPPTPQANPWAASIEDHTHTHPTRPLWTRAALHTYDLPLSSTRKLEQANVTVVPLRAGMARPVLSDGFDVKTVPSAPPGVESAVESAVSSSIVE